MIIDKEGNILKAWIRGNGPIIKDSDNPYDMNFSIALKYNAEQKQAFYDIYVLKKYLQSTDYKAIKYAEGEISEEEYAPIKAERARARERINEMTFPEPTLTREQIDEAERKAMEHLGGIK